MIDIVEPKTNSYSLINKIIKKHIDFVVIDKKGYTVCAFEIDDNSHNRKQQQKSDKVKDFILNDIGIPLIRVKGIDQIEIENKLKKLIKRGI